jgi:hypothetical protein
LVANIAQRRRDQAPLIRYDPALHYLEAAGHEARGNRWS